MADNQNNDFKARLKKATADADARHSSGQQQSAPSEQAPQGRAPRDKTAWHFHFHPWTFLKWGVVGGAAGATLYAARSLWPAFGPGLVEFALPRRSWFLRR